MFAANSKDKPSGSVCNLLNCDDAEVDQIVTNRTHKYFNAGMFVTDLEIWRKHQITTAIKSFMLKNKERRLWRWGSQGPMVITFYGKWEHVGYVWNERKYGLMSQAELGVNTTFVRIYHFTSVKPWRSDESAQPIWPIWCPFYKRNYSLWFCRSEGLASTSVWDFHFLADVAFY